MPNDFFAVSMSTGLFPRTGLSTTPFSQPIHSLTYLLASTSAPLQHVQVLSAAGRKSTTGVPMIKEIPHYHFKALFQEPTTEIIPKNFTEAVADRVHKFHKQLPGYNPTELVELKELAGYWGVDNIFVKDESSRFGLRAFKVLGGSYAVAQLICRELNIRLEDTDLRTPRK